MTSEPSPPPTILCALDFSPAAGRALHWAVEAARRWGCNLQLLTVVPSPDQTLVGIAQDRLDEVASSLAPRGVLATTHVVAGEPHQQIAAWAEQTRPLLIAMGGGGHSALGRFLLGSVADRTLRAATRPVVFVSPDGPLPGRPESDQPGARSRLLVGIDASPGSEAALSFVRELRRTVACDVTFVHCYWPIEEYERLGLRGRRDFTTTDPDVVANLEPGLRLRIGVLPGSGEVRLQIRSAWGAPFANLEMAAEEGPYDLVVVGAHTRHGLARLWHPSVAGALVHRDHRLPVLCVPAAFVDARSEPIPAIATVLAATDFSPLANAAVIHAYSLVRQHGGVVELCHVHEHYLPTPSFAYQAPKATLSDDQRRTLEEKLRALIPAAAIDYGITTHVTVVDGGEAAQVIAQTAERLHVNAICVGTHGRGGVAGALAGSVARGVLELAHVPVMMVRASAAAGGRV